MFTLLLFVGGIALALLSHVLNRRRRRAASVCRKVMWTAVALAVLVLALATLTAGGYGYWYTHRAQPAAVRESLFRGI